MVYDDFARSKEMFLVGQCLYKNGSVVVEGILEMKYIEVLFYYTLASFFSGVNISSSIGGA